MCQIVPQPSFWPHHPNIWNWASIVDRLSMPGWKSWTQRGKTSALHYQSTSRRKGAAWVQNRMFTAEGLPTVQLQLPTNQLDLKESETATWVLLAGLLSDRCEVFSYLHLWSHGKIKAKLKKLCTEFYKVVTINASVSGFQRSKGSMEKVSFCCDLFILTVSPQCLHWPNDMVTDSCLLTEGKTQTGQKERTANLAARQGNTTLNC